MGERSGFVSEGKECRLYVAMLERFEAKCPIVSSRTIHKNESKFESPD
jgi:hypothetical protein